MRPLKSLSILAIAGGCMPLGGAAAQATADAARRPVEVFWGDTHVHTALSVDSFVANQRLDPDDAYHQALGDPVFDPRAGALRRRNRPLDFVVIADHAENLGFLPALEHADGRILDTDFGTAWYERFARFLPAIRNRDPARVANWYDEFRDILPGGNHERIRELIFHRYLLQYRLGDDEAFLRSEWDAVIRRAEQYNDPGRFTAFIGYEWTPIELFNHRIVVFDGGPEIAIQTHPFTAIDSTAPEDLWDYFSEYRSRTGGDVIGIPHNGNLTLGHMFLPEDSHGRPLTRHYAEVRSRWEPLVEITQIKGDGETHPSLSPDDEFADFETWLSYNEGEDRGRRYEYARAALKSGLEFQQSLGVNPFKFGMIGATDNHNALPGPGDKGIDDFLARDEAPQALFEAVGPPGNYWSAGGYTAVWAEENTRKSLFAAMKRREVYATTGSRIRLRFFGGWSYASQDSARPDLVRVGYEGGVPMGGDLSDAPAGGKPRFLIHVMRDPLGANLDRVQIVKGWIDEQGMAQEKVVNVAVSDDRTISADGRVAPLESTVNIAASTYTNAIGDPVLATVWEDPDFEPDVAAFYYVRVLEIPTPRWSTYYASRMDADDIPADFPMEVQERAYSSPIWYTP